MVFNQFNSLVGISAILSEWRTRLFGKRCFEPCNPLLPIGITLKSQLMKSIFYFIISVFIIAVFSCCEKPINDGCYSSELEEDHLGGCFADCHGVCGCSGVTYCNECKASKAVIKEVTAGACN